MELSPDPFAATAVRQRLRPSWSRDRDAAVNPYANLVEHYIASLARRRRLVAAVVLSCMLATLALSTAMLVAAPRYTASAIVTMLPTDSELSYTRNWLGRSLIDPVTISTATHLEYLHSRPVLERTLDRILETYAPPPATGWRADLRAAVRAASESAWRIYETANYGRYVPVSERDDLLNQLAGGIEITPMQASYILLIDATFNDPVLAALAANALAEAYVGHATTEAAGKTRGLRGFLERRMADRQQAVEVLAADIQRLEQAIGASGDVDIVARSVAAERAALADAERALAAAQGADPAGSAVMAAAARADTLRERAAAAEARLVLLQGDRDRLTALRRDLDGQTLDMADLRQQLLTADLALADTVHAVRVIEPAVPPRQPAAPKVLSYTLAAGIVGAVLAVMLVVGLDIFDSRLGTLARLRQVAGARALGALPRRLFRRVRDGRLAGLGRDSAMQALAAALTRRIERSGAGRTVTLCTAGLGDRDDVTDASFLVATALREAGVEVRLAAEEAAPEDRSGTGADGGGRVVRLRPRCAAGVWRPAKGDHGAVLVLCFVPAASATEADVVAWCDELDVTGIRDVWFVLTDSGRP